ncbi:MAG: DUF4239 domain-containing protein [Gluconacetobacter diazotrophicus]|nr:DUF4239 domain-containing protein [Gluconacetobacter diazotrophicus]
MLWLYDLPTWLLAVLTVGAFLAVSVGGLLFSRHHVTKWLVFSREINEAVNFFGTAVAALYSVTLGLIAVAVWSNFSSVSGLVSKEAASIGVLYRDMGGYPEPLRNDLRAKLRRYTAFVVEKSWPLQQKGILNDDSTLMVADIHEQMIAYQPTDASTQILHTEAMHKFNEMADLRRQRIDQVDSHLPGTLWTVLLAGAVLTILTGYFFWIEDVRFHILMISILTMFISLMIFLIVALDRPFRGEVSVSADSYRTILQRVMDPLDHATAAGGAANLLNPTPSGLVNNPR